MSHYTMEGSARMSAESFGLLCLLASAAFFSVMGLFVQRASSRLPSTQIVFMRAIFQGTLTLVGMVFLPAQSDAQGVKGRALIRSPFGGTRQVRNVVIARGAVGGFGFVSFYYTMSALPLGDAVALVSLKSVFTVIAGWLILGEVLKPSHFCAAIASVTGATLIARPTFLFGYDDEFHGAAMRKARPLGYLTAMLGACCGTAVFLLIRKCGRLGAHTLQLMISWAVFGIVFGLLFGKILCGPGKPLGDIDGGDWGMPDSKALWHDVLAVCIFGLTAHFLLNFSARIAPAGLSSVVKSSEMVWAYLWQTLYFHQTPSVLTITGVLLICCSLVTIAIQKMADERNVTPAATGVVNEGTSLMIDGDETDSYTAEAGDAQMHEPNNEEMQINCRNAYPAKTVSQSSLTALVS